MSGGETSQSGPSDSPTSRPSVRWGLLPRVLLAQITALALTLLLAIGLTLILGAARPPLWSLAGIQGVVACAIGWKIGFRGAWLLAQFALPLLAWACLSLDIPPWLFLVTFVLLFLVYSNTSRERVPLYLTNRKTWSALLEVFEEEALDGKPLAVIDLGCGLGGLLVFLAAQRPDWRFVGVETAPGPYLVSKIRTLPYKNADVRYKSLWDVDLSTFDVVYAFLSPEPMPRLLGMAADSMRPGSILISNSFWAPDKPYDGEVEVNDGRKSRLFYKRMQKID